LWNGWTTARRFQTSRPCVLGCCSEAEDSIEHYARCHFTRQIVVDWMGLDGGLVDLTGFLLVQSGMSENERALMSIVVYAVFRATSHFRHSSTYPAASTVTEYLQQMCQNAVFGHCSRKTLDQATHFRHIRDRT
jgi:hypothetical protein